MDRRNLLLLALLAAGIALVLSRTKRGQEVVTQATDTIAAGAARVKAGAMEVLAKLVEHIGYEEGLRLTPYKDQAGIWTIGYGHKILPTDGIYPYGEKQAITKQEAALLLDRDMTIAKRAVQSSVRVPLTVNEYTALVSLAFNIGASAFAGSTLVRLLNAGDRAGAAAQFAVWNKITRNGAKVTDSVLVARRAREAALFSTPSQVMV